MAYNCLVVDDERIICDGMQRALASTGWFEVYKAYNGLDALRIVEEEKIDAVFLDIEMPDMNGVDFMKTLSAEDRHPVTVIVSGYDDFEYVREALRYGALDYILKPVDSQDVRGLAERVLQTLESSDTLRELTKELPKGIKTTPAMISDYISDNYENPELSVTEIAKALGYSPNYLGSIFKNEFGTSINDCINRKRIDRACELIKSSDMKMYEISSAVGYTDQHYFSKLFKKYTGINPTEYT